MMLSMAETSNELETRRSLLLRLRDWSDEASWREFFDLYWRLIYGAARKSGLSDAASQDVVQQTIITVAQNIGGFDYDPERGSFKAWLLRVTRTRIADEMRRAHHAKELHVSTPENESRQTTWIERVPDPACAELDDYWEREWRRTVLDAALEKMKGKVNKIEYEIFERYALQSQPVADVARILGVTEQQIYSAKHKLTELLKKEVKRLETKIL